LQVASKSAIATHAFTPQLHVHFFSFEPFGFTGASGSSGSGAPGSAPSSLEGDGHATPCLRQ
jgi:hypothetical protein